MTYEQACTQARAILGGMDAIWLTASCADIAQHLRNDLTLFRAPNDIRTALVGVVGTPPISSPGPSPISGNSVVTWIERNPVPTVAVIIIIALLLFKK